MQTEVHEATTFTHWVNFPDPIFINYLFVNNVKGQTYSFWNKRIFQWDDIWPSWSKADNFQNFPRNQKDIAEYSDNWEELQ